MRITVLCMATLALTLGACAKDPRDPQTVTPASQAAGAAEPAAVPASEMQVPTIYSAQIGMKVGDNGLLAEPSLSIAANAPIHGLAVFKGPDGATGDVELQIFDANEQMVFNQEKPYTVQGQTSVGFDVGAAKPLPQGKYRALFLCNGGPCWEVPFSIE